MQKRTPAYLAIYPIALAVDSMLWPFFKFLYRKELSTVQIKRLSFYGDSRLHELAHPTLERIKGIDPKIHSEILDTPMTLTIEWKKEEKKDSIPIRSTLKNRFCILDWMIDAGVDSIAFGIVDYFHRYHSRLSTPFTSRILDPKSWMEKSMNQTKDWLVRNEFNPSTIEYLEKTWYSKN